MVPDDPKGQLKYTDVTQTGGRTVLQKPGFVPEYFSGLNWREAEKKELVRKKIMVSNDGDIWAGPFVLRRILTTPASSRFQANCGWWTYIRTTPETHTHPTINIGGVELPRPETEAPERETPVYAVNGSFIKHTTWSGNWNYERCDLEDGKIHLTEERAQAWADWWENTVLAAVTGGER